MVSIAGSDKFRLGNVELMDTAVVVGQVLS
jgi:hypothetical protein